jgi:glutamate formiminotransferase
MGVPVVPASQMNNNSKDEQKTRKNRQRQPTRRKRQCSHLFMVFEEQEKWKKDFGETILSFTEGD